LAAMKANSSATARRSSLISRGLTFPGTRRCGRPSLRLAGSASHRLFDGAQDSYGGGGVAALGMPMRV
jgi:hypothetical protein